jgi:ubiquinone/menaquinone biosynthesis C-methylase UbiE
MSTFAYLDRAAASEVGQRYKARLLAAMDLAPGQTVLDLGCGPGTDLAGLAEAVGPTGRVVGMDVDRDMVAEAARRHAGRSTVDVRVGDGQALPLPDATVDRVRVDRVLQHVEEPGRVLAEVRRVLRPGGLVGLADPDWDTLTVDDEDIMTSRAYTRFVTGEAVRNAAMGRQLARLAATAGLTVHSVESLPVLFTDYASAEEILRLPQVAARAVEAGYLTADAVRDWLGRLTTRSTFVAGFTVYVVTAAA